VKRIVNLLCLLTGTAGAACAAAPARPPITGVSHIAVYAADPIKSERFYAHDLGAAKGADPENPRGVRYYFAPAQFVEVLPLPDGPPSINRLDHVAFATPDAGGLRDYLAARKIAVPRREVEDGFFRTVLGFKPYWFGGNRDDSPTWISTQVPDGTDWLEYMVVGTPDGRGIPATMKPSDLGVLDHFSLGVVNAEAAYTLLWNGERLAGQDNVPKIGRDAKWQLNLLDPDGTRAEVMELHAIGKPCCSPFTASDPQK
jgi:catechol 2,3-dioxygenase-like lactoylglutathione lyase family enzyme